MTDAGHPLDDHWEQPPTPDAGRFILDAPDQESAPRRAQWLRDWWWSGTRTQRWTAAIGAPLAALLVAGTLTALAAGTPDQQTTATATTSERPGAESTANPTPAPSSTPTGTVITILTGDTIVVSRDSRTETVRLIGIDAPEIAGSSAGEQCWATQSIAFATDTLRQQQVTLTPDPTQGDVDSSGATLAYVRLPDGRDFSVVSAGQGFARSDNVSTPASKTAEIAAAEQTARTGGLGLWGPPCNGRLSMPLPTVTPTPSSEPPPVPPPPPVVTDPRFDNCLQVKANGYGPYVRGVDPEYYWYPDRDGNGIVCERPGNG